MAQVWDGAPEPPIHRGQASTELAHLITSLLSQLPQTSTGLTEPLIGPLGSLAGREGVVPPSGPIGGAQSPPIAADIHVTPPTVRGRGSYVCPHGFDCKKGGVQASGELATFERNCAFR